MLLSFSPRRAQYRGRSDKRGNGVEVLKRKCGLIWLERHPFWHAGAVAGGFRGSSHYGCFPIFFRASHGHQRGNYHQGELHSLRIDGEHLAWLLDEARRPSSRPNAGQERSISQ